MTEPTTPPEGTTEGSGEPIGTAAAAPIQPLGLERSAQIAANIGAWWAKHGPAIVHAIREAVAIMPPFIPLRVPASPPPTTPPPSSTTP